MSKFLYLMSHSGSAFAWIEERIPPLLGLLVCADELQLDEVPLNGPNELVRQRASGCALRTQDRERIVDRR